MIETLQQELDWWRIQEWGDRGLRLRVESLLQAADEAIAERDILRAELSRVNLVLQQCEQTSAGRLAQLARKAEQARIEWIRAENAEAENESLKADLALAASGLPGAAAAAVDAVEAYMPASAIKPAQAAAPEQEATTLAQAVHILGQVEQAWRITGTHQQTQQALAVVLSTLAALQGKDTPYDLG